MVVQDPSGELVDLVRSLGDPAPPDAPRAACSRAALIRRRFGLALPPPFADLAGGDEPIRLATPFDGPAIASVKWRCFGTNYRGVFPDAFLDGRDVVPPPAYWTGRAMVPPSKRHALFVWGRAGVVHGYVDCGPSSMDDPSDPTGEVFELYVDPCRQGAGGGLRLLRRAETFLEGAGFSRGELSVVDANESARSFYERSGWTDTGRTVEVDLGVVSFTERRMARPCLG